MIRKMYKTILPSQIIMMLMMNLNSIIDSFFAGHFLTTVHLSAIGFYSPISNIVYLCYVLITGTQILSGQAIGKGDKDRTFSLFTTSGAAIFGYGLIMAAAFLALGRPLAALVGAKDAYADAFCLYLAGLSFGVPFMMLECFFMSFLKLNDRNDLVMISIVSMVLINTVLDFVLIAVLHMGILGLSVASSVTNIVVAVIGFLGFVPRGNRTLAIGFQPRQFHIRSLPGVLRNGLTQFSFNMALMVNGLLINYILIAAGGEQAVALMTVFNTFNTFIGVLASGTQEAQLSIGSIFYGMKNRDDFIGTFRLGTKLIYLMLGIGYAAVFLLAGPLSSIYFAAGTEMHDLCVIMLRIAMLSVLPLALSDTLSTAYQCQSKMKYPNAMQYIRTALRLAFMAAFAKLFGINGAWIGMDAGCVLVVLITYVYIFVCRKHFTLRFEDSLLLDDDFGAAPENVFEKNLSSLDDAVQTSEQLQRFCLDRGFPEKAAYHIGLCCEELAGNIFEYGRPGKTAAELYFVIDGASCVIQLMDNCREFNPSAYLAQFRTDDPGKNIGLRIVSSVAGEMKYQRFLGINSVTVHISRDTDPRDRPRAGL